MDLAKEAQIKNDMVAVQADFPVMVWGSGEKSPYYNKRKQIRNDIKNKFPNADPFFPEERMDMKEFSFLETVEKKEGAMTVASGAILALETSDGPRQEVARYVHIAPEKFLLMIPKQYESAPGYAPLLRKGVKKHGFTEKDVEECNLVQVCVDFVLSVAWNKFIGASRL